MVDEGRLDAEKFFRIHRSRIVNTERIKELLALCNWLAAPLGTSEFMFRKYGIEGTHYTMENGAPVRSTTRTSPGWRSRSTSGTR
mgnify:CR=1 FL=1